MHAGKKLMAPNNTIWYNNLAIKLGNTYAVKQHDDGSITLDAIFRITGFLDLFHCPVF
jgi:hypothetical protein